MCIELWYGDKIIKSFNNDYYLGLDLDQVVIALALRVLLKEDLFKQLFILRL